MISSWYRFDTDWSRPIPEIDAQLYAKYGLTEAEQKFIESMIKRWSLAALSAVV